MVGVPTGQQALRQIQPFWHAVSSCLSETGGGVWHCVEQQFVVGWPRLRTWRASRWPPQVLWIALSTPFRGGILWGIQVLDLAIVPDLVACHETLGWHGTFLGLHPISLIVSRGAADRRLWTQWARWTTDRQSVWSAVWATAQ